MALSVTVYNQEGLKVASEELPEDIFGLKRNDTLVHQVYTIKLGNMRRPYAHTKDRSEKRGGGRKPWRQKGTGRARHGSIRSPLWVGGGVTFGPRNERVFSKRINKKMNRKALSIVLSSKIHEGTLYIIDSLNFSDPKTKNGVRLFDKLNKTRSSSLVLGARDDKNFVRVFKNIPYAKPININRINIVDMLNNKNCVFSKDALHTLIHTYANHSEHIQKGKRGEATHASPKSQIGKKRGASADKRGSTQENTSSKK